MKTIIPKKAFVLAAGKGTRLGEITTAIPKCLVSVAGKALLGYQLEKLKDFGVEQVCINLHHKSDQVRRFIESYGDPGLEIVFSDEPELLDTGGALKKAGWFFSSEEPFFVVNADILTDYPLNLIADGWESGTSMGVFACRERAESSRLILDQDGNVSGLALLESPFSENSRAFSGLALYSPRILPLIRECPQTIFSIKEIWQKTFEDGSPKFATVDITEENYWFDIGTPDSLASARKLVEVQG